MTSGNGGPRVGTEVVSWESVTTGAGASSFSEGWWGEVKVRFEKSGRVGRETGELAICGGI